jgi:putative mycofactocin binding protein MftB
MSVPKGTRVYHLPEGVRVRREEFGLLFYNSADTRLTFVKSGDSLLVERKPEGLCVLRLGSTIGQQGDEGRIGRLIETLMTKGLIVETRTTI